jgi:hypothetical protein
VDASNNCIIPAKGSINAGSIHDASGNTFLTNNNRDNSGKIFTPGYNSATSTINFSDAGWTSSGSSEICAKQSWANKNSLEWDGITNYNSCT